MDFHTLKKYHPRQYLDILILRIASASTRVLSSRVLTDHAEDWPPRCPFDHTFAAYFDHKVPRKILPSVQKELVEETSIGRKNSTSIRRMLAVSESYHTRSPLRCAYRLDALTDGSV